MIILGVANLVADGFSMAVSNYLGSRAETQQREQARREEQRQIELIPEGEREEIRQVFAAKGFTGDGLERIVDVITSNPKVWVDTMMTEELGYGTDAANPLRAAASTLIAFVVIGFLPLAVFVYDAATPGDVPSPFIWSAVLTGAAFLIVGAVKARFVEQPAWRSALETLAVGGGAAEPCLRHRRQRSRASADADATRRLQCPDEHPVGGPGQSPSERRVGCGCRRHHRPATMRGWDSPTVATRDACWPPTCARWAPSIRSWSRFRAGAFRSPPRSRVPWTLRSTSSRCARSAPRTTRSSASARSRRTAPPSSTRRPPAAPA